MRPAIIAPRALRDLKLAVRAIAQENPSAARRFPPLVLRLADRLGRFPDLGAYRPEIVNPPFRVIPIRGYPQLVIYDASTSPPTIVRILHGSRNLVSMLQDLSSIKPQS